MKYNSTGQVHDTDDHGFSVNYTRPENIFTWMAHVLVWQSGLQQAKHAARFMLE